MTQTSETTETGGRAPSYREPFLEAGAGDHIVQFYEGDEYLTDLVARFLAAGMAAGEAAVAAVTAGHRRGIREILATSGFDVARAELSGRLAFLDAEETLAAFMDGNLPDAARFRTVVGRAVERACAASPSGAVRAVGEMVNLLWLRRNPAGALLLEELWNELQRTHRFSLLCAYGMASFERESDGDDLDRICSTHTHVVPTERWSALDDPEARRREVTFLQQRASALQHEIAERRRAEEAQRRLRIELDEQLTERREADRRKDEFLATLAHELRNPLAPIGNGLELMARSPGDAALADEVRAMMQRQLGHLVRLVDDLLDVSRISRNKLRLVREVVTLGDVVADALATSRPLIEQYGHRLAVSVPDEPIAVDADATRLAQVFANLLNNAARYTPDGGRLGVIVARHGAEAYVTITDDGIGIPAAALPHVFEMFAQADTSMEKARTGLGIGLSLVKRLVELHGGSVSAQSEGKGRGSRLTVRLPVAAAAAPRRRPSEAAGDATVARRILVADDNEDSLTTLAALLRHCGHEVTVARNGSDAVAEAARCQPDVALLDIGMPELNGYEVAARIREQSAAGRCPLLIALTGYGQDTDRRRAKDAGFAFHFVKPLDFRALQRLLASDLGA